MMGNNTPPDGDDRGQFSSPPCFMHETDVINAGAAADRAQTRDVARWRKAERARLIAGRMALPVSIRTKNSTAIADQLDSLVPSGRDTIVSVYWPFRGEPNLRPWMKAMHEKGVQVALPLVEEKGKPLSFRLWSPKARLARGIWNIPYPVDGDVVVPNVVISPLVGFDPGNFRLGYGGGYFDRTLAALDTKPLVIGVGHPSLAIDTIYPQPHDIPMDWIATGEDPPIPRK